ncbi:MAG: phosphatidate cytidylyltransferase [Methylocella sp.]
MICAAPSPVLLAMLNDAADAAGKDPRPPNFSGRRCFADLLPRVLSAIVLMAAALVSVWLGGLAFDLIWLGAALAVGCEWQNLIAARNPRLRFFLVALGLVVSAYFAGKAWFGSACSLLGGCGLALALVAGPGRRIWAFGGIAYAGLLLVSAAALHGSAEYGARSIVWLFAIVWGTDVVAYFGGRLIGGAKLWPRISPSKTWSGTLAGVLAGAFLGAVIGAQGLGDSARALPLFPLGLAAAAVSQGGDIFESWVKRQFGAKDSSGLIPGHGGFMDRLDGFIAAAAFAALFGSARGSASIAAGLFDWV